MIQVNVGDRVVIAKGAEIDSDHPSRRYSVSRTDNVVLVSYVDSNHIEWRDSIGYRRWCDISYAVRIATDLDCSKQKVTLSKSERLLRELQGMNHERLIDLALTQHAAAKVLESEGYLRIVMVDDQGLFVRLLPKAILSKESIHQKLLEAIDNISKRKDPTLRDLTRAASLGCNKDTLEYLEELRLKGLVELRQTRHGTTRVNRAVATAVKR